MATIGSVSSVYRFPVKSMQGEAPTSVDIDTDGVSDDRVWALRDSESGKLVSAKRPRLWRSTLDCTASGTGDDVLVTLPSGEAFGIHDPGLPIALEALFGRAVAVERATRPQQGTYESDWPEIEGLTLAGEFDFATNLTGEGTTFVDVGVLHLLTTTSVAAIAETVSDAAVDARRFRPSILLDTPSLEGFPENDWSGRTLTIGDVVLTLGDPTPRCVMTTVSQPGLGQAPEVLRAIASENRLTNELGTFACLGCYATVERGGTVGVGAPVDLE